ncbi:lanthionine synthetase C family protein [Kitasatospora cineracea]|uniref:lanthionine synthetase C family protein n=1 Tax=Kitasatospora cineracea TaxID=88074 RepID=UPI00369B55BC
MTPTEVRPAHRAQALRLADALTDRLRDPDALPHAGHGTGSDERWKTASLASGHAGIALLFAQRALRVPQERHTAHRYVELAAASLRTQPAPHHGLLYEVAGLGFALHLTGHGVGYARALSALDARCGAAAAALARLVESVPLGPMARYDALDGLAGLGRYLLLRGLGPSADMEQLLKALVAMTATTGHRGREVPRYWSTTPPNWHPDADPELRASGHLNLGMGHGIAGPLAMLATAHLQGARVEGQSEAIGRLVALLERFRSEDEHGPYWPPTVSLPTYEGTASGRRRGRVAWCYGAPGISRALQLAGRALDRQDWAADAEASVVGLTRLPPEQFGMEHWSLCHGWAGVLHLLGYFTDGPSGPRIVELRERVAARIIDDFDTAGLPPLQLGHDRLGEGCHPAGFLEGAAGLALALDAYARPGEETLPWDTALLLN